jgi:single-stranded-DNA-specific exonuclease
VVSLCQGYRFTSPISAALRRSNRSKPFCGPLTDLTGLTPSFRNSPSYLVLEMLVPRFGDLDLARAFLHPDSSLPVSFPGIGIPAEIIRTTIRRGEKICVWGDFDVDGQTSTTLLVQTLRSLGADVRYYIPVRSRESHGVHIESLIPIIESGTRLLLTCDTGITAFRPDHAQGRPAIITDHRSR